MNTDRSIKEIMTTKLVTVLPDSGVNEVKKIFDKNKLFIISRLSMRGMSWLALSAKKIF